jgi:hypothetical protein
MIFFITQKKVQVYFNRLTFNDLRQLYLSCFSFEFKKKNLNLDKLSQLQSSIAEQSIATFFPGQESRLSSTVHFLGSHL